MQPLVSVSVVSHLQSDLVASAVADLQRSSNPLEVLVTINVPEPHSFRDAETPQPTV